MCGIDLVVVSQRWRFVTIMFIFKESRWYEVTYTMIVVKIEFSGAMLK